MLPLLAAEDPAAGLGDLLLHPVVILIGSALGVIAAVIMVALQAYKRARPQIEQVVRTSVNGQDVLEIETRGDAKAVENPSGAMAVQSHYEQIIVEQRNVNMALGQIVEGYRGDVAGFRTEVQGLKADRARDAATIAAQAHEISMKEETIESLRDLIAQYKMDAERNYLKIEELERLLRLKTEELDQLKAKVEILEKKEQ